MYTQMDTQIANKYFSNSQKIRVITENWVASNMFCPFCGEINISQFENNRPVADFYCPKCKEQYELKSKDGSIGGKITDGAYCTMIERINSTNNPNFFLLQYDKADYTVHNFMLIPKHFFVTDIIEKRKPLSQTAKRAGWIGCNINISQIPSQGRIFIVKDKESLPIEEVVGKLSKTKFISEQGLQARGWILDTLNCVNSIKGTNFTLDQMYEFENLLSAKHPKNKHVKAKIRQQLQILRDKGFIEFGTRGNYTKLT